MEGAITNDISKADNVLVVFGTFNFSNRKIASRCPEYDLECIAREAGV
jgi:hypothetical protein